MSWNKEKRTQDVGKKAPNALGIYDMSGNVREWVWDWNIDWPTTAKTDYRGPTIPSDPPNTWARAFRGGAYWDGPVLMKVGRRLTSSDGSWVASYDRGFRVARSQ